MQAFRQPKDPARTRSVDFKSIYVFYSVSEQLVYFVFIYTGTVTLKVDFFVNLDEH